MRRGALLLFTLLLAGCRGEEPVTLTGRVTDARSGEGLADAQLTVPADERLLARTGRDGWYVAPEPRDGDTIIITRGGYRPRTTVLQFVDGEGARMLRNYTLEKVPDTAYTAMGPVDASMFLDNDQVRRKKLSLNEARIVVQEKFPGSRVYKGTLVMVGEQQEWVFDVRIGHASAAVYLDIYSGEIRSIESDDPNLDRKLQDMIGK